MTKRCAVSTFGILFTFVLVFAFAAAFCFGTRLPGTLASCPAASSGPHCTSGLGSMPSTPPPVNASRNPCGRVERTEGGRADGSVRLVPSRASRGVRPGGPYPACRERHGDPRQELGGGVSRTAGAPGEPLSAGGRGAEEEEEEEGTALDRPPRAHPPSCPARGPARPPGSRWRGRKRRNAAGAPRRPRHPRAPRRGWAPRPRGRARAPSASGRTTTPSCRAGGTPSGLLLLRFRRVDKRGEGGVRGRISGGKPGPRARASPEAPLKP